ncbi:MAG: betaine-aldehyde dehydrogenase [Ilumatobacter sp.]
MSVTPTEDGQAALDELIPDGDEFAPCLRRFAALTVLSGSIAAVGLLSDSAAVVIGAMLVAPLMVPITAAAAATVRAQNDRLIRSVLVISLGVLLAVAVGCLSCAVAGFDIVSEADLPGEVANRTLPGLLDLGVAITAGAAAGYISTRQTTTSALPGVGIAVALVPPLATVAILIQLGRPRPRGTRSCCSSRTSRRSCSPHRLLGDDARRLGSSVMGMVSVDASTTLPTVRSYIDGRYVDSTSGETFDAVYPATNRTICVVEQAGDAEIEASVEAAQRGFETWSVMPAIERSRILSRAVAIIRERNDELAALDTLDTGKPIAETTTEDVVTGADVIEFYAGLVPTLHGETIDFPGQGFARMKREPLGVCVGIGAWNYPIQIAMWKSALALSCGNAMIFKPAEMTPISTGVLAEIYSEAGVPDGVFNVLQGDARVGQALVRHPGVAKVSLTGEVSTGKAVMSDAAATLKGVTLELGGKSPIVVFDDADLDSARNAALTNNFYSTGQVCSNGTRVFVQRAVYEEFLAPIAERVAALKVGDPFDPDTTIGPLVSAEHHDKVMRFMKLARDSGARHIIGGDVPTDPALAGGNYVMPAVYADCTDDMEFVTDEVFGPLMAVLPFDTEDEVVGRANATPYGLAAAVFSSDFARANRVANSLQAGSVWINDYGTLPASLPFGGYKQSGIGRENGANAIEHYTQVKMIYSSIVDVDRYM